MSNKTDATALQSKRVRTLIVIGAQKLRTAPRTDQNSSEADAHSVDTDKSVSAK